MKARLGVTDWPEKKPSIAEIAFCCWSPSHCIHLKQLVSSWRPYISTHPHNQLASPHTPNTLPAPARIDSRSVQPTTNSASIVGLSARSIRRRVNLGFVAASSHLTDRSTCPRKAPPLLRFLCDY